MIYVTGIEYKVGQRVYAPQHKLYGKVIGFSSIDSKFWVSVKFDNECIMLFSLDGYREVVFRDSHPEWRLQVVVEDPKILMDYVSGFPVMRNSYDLSKPDDWDEMHRKFAHCFTLITGDSWDDRFAERVKNAVLKEFEQTGCALGPKYQFTEDDPILVRDHSAAKWLGRRFWKMDGNIFMDTNKTRWAQCIPFDVNKMGKV